MLITSIQGGGDNYYVGNNNATRNVNAGSTTTSERFNLQDVPYWRPDRPSNEYPRINYNPSFPHPLDRQSTRLNSSHYCASRMPSSASKKKQNIIDNTIHRSH